MSHWQIWAKQWLNQQHRIHTRPILATGKESSGQGQQQWVWTYLWGLNVRDER